MTILGMWSVAELKDLLAAKDFDIAQIETARGNMPSAPDSSWDIDWSAFKDRYNSARNIANFTIGAARASVASDSVIPANTEYNGVLHALTQVEGEQQPTDFQGLYTRLTSALGHQLDFSKQPQPRKGTDTDINVLQTADNVVLKPLASAGKGAASTAEKYGPWIVGGLLAAWALRSRIL